MQILNIRLKRNAAKISLKLSEITPNFPRFGPQIFFGGIKDHKFWDSWIVKLNILNSGHVAMFHVDRSKELGDLAVKQRKEKKKKHQQQNIKPPGTT